MEKALRAQRHHLESSTALWTLSALALTACGGGGGGGDGDNGGPMASEITSPEGFYAEYGDIDTTLLYGGTNPDTFDGSADTFNVVFYTNSPSGITIDLSDVEPDGYVHGFGGDSQGDKLKNIEDIVGSAYNDVLIGDAGDNDLWGGAGADTLDGGAGDDAVIYFDSPSGVTINLSDVQSDGYVHGAGGDAQGDRLKNIEDIAGSAYDDELTGDAGNNWLWGSAGADMLDGGVGDDAALYLDSPSSVMIDLSRTDANGYATGSGGHAQGDKLRNIESLFGSAYDDELIGNAEDNALYGGDGADTLTGGAGADYFWLNVEAPAHSLSAADVITDYDRDVDYLMLNTDITGTPLWFENRVDADVGIAGANDTVIYSTANKSDIIVILADHNDDISNYDFFYSSDVSTITEIT